MPSSPGISTSSSATSAPRSTGGGHHLVAAPDLGDHLEVGLEPEQRGQRAAHERLVVGEQQPDRRARQRCTRSRKPPLVRRPTATSRPRGGRPLAQAGEAVPAVEPRAVEPPRRGPAAVVRDLDAVRRQPHAAPRRAPLCRTTFVTPSRTAQANSSRRSAGHVVDGARAGPRRCPPPRARRRADGELPGQRHLAVPDDGRADVGQRLPAPAARPRRSRAPRAARRLERAGRRARP